MFIIQSTINNSHYHPNTQNNILLLYLTKFTVHSVELSLVMNSITEQTVYNSIYNLQLRLSPYHTLQYITSITNYFHSKV